MGAPRQYYRGAAVGILSRPVDSSEDDKILLPSHHMKSRLHDSYVKAVFHVLFTCLIPVWRWCQPELADGFADQLMDERAGPRLVGDILANVQHHL